VEDQVCSSVSPEFWKALDYVSSTFFEGGHCRGSWPMGRRLSARLLALVLIMLDILLGELEGGFKIID
jgi:hypothetical protein